MARKKNALRKHSVAEFEGYDENGVAIPVVEDSYLRLARFVQNITDGSQEETSEEGDYAGDGTAKTEVSGIAERWTFTGTYDAENPAQALIVGKKRKFGDERKVWHKIEQTDGTVVEGLATASEIRGGSGDATAFEEFNCTLSFDEVPTVTPEA